LICQFFENVPSTKKPIYWLPFLFAIIQLLKISAFYACFFIDLVIFLYHLKIDLYFESSVWFVYCLLEVILEVMSYTKGYLGLTFWNKKLLSQYNISQGCPTCPKKCFSDPNSYRNWINSRIQAFVTRWFEKCITSRIRFTYTRNFGAPALISNIIVHNLSENCIEKSIKKSTLKSPKRYRVSY
jgi:hypothetical protein